MRAALSEASVDSYPPDIATLVVDLSDMYAVRRAATEALERFPVIDGLVLSVGELVQGGPNVLPSGHELMFATNVMGPFLLTELLVERLERSDGLVLHVIAPFDKEIDWGDLESIRHHRSMAAFDRTKVFNRMIAGELARRYEGRISSVAFDPAFVIDKSDPDLRKRWPTGPWGLLWRLMTVFVAKPPATAGEPLADLMLSHPDRGALNGALFKLYERVEKPDAAMNDTASGKRLWEELELRTGLVPGSAAGDRGRTRS